MPSDSA